MARVFRPCPVCGRIRHRGVSVAALFETHVVRGDGCWIWMGARSAKSYGTVFGHGSSRYAHRAAWELHFGPIPAGMFVCHHCDNPPCVRPDHLFLGTPSANMWDKVHKGRANTPTRVGEHNGFAKLTEADVREIRRRRATGETRVSVGLAFGIHEGTVKQITSRKTWRHVV